MHDAAFAFYRKELGNLEPLDVLEFGSYNINGSVRDTYPQAKSWWGIDIASGPGVDQVADASLFLDEKRYDVVVCAEAFEHTPAWTDIIENAHRHLKNGGLFIASCASRDRPPHSAFDGGVVREGEYYSNVSPAEMQEYMMELDWEKFEIIPADGYFGNDDLYIKAIK